MRNSIALILVLLLVACGGAGDGGDAPSEASSDSPSVKPAQAARIFDESVSEDPCELLTPAMVAQVAEVAIEQVEQRSIGGMCLYEWEGGQANLGFVRTFESAEKAMIRFDNAHKSMTDAEVEAAMQQIGELAKEKLEEDAEDGESVPDPEQVDPVVGAMAGSMGGGITFEAIEGLGDKAAYETTRHETKIMDRTLISYANSLDVLVGNLSFDVSFALDSEGDEGKMFRDEAIALARAVLDHLPD